MADWNPTTTRRTPWTSVHPYYHWELPKEPGCYAFYMDGELVYIGQTQNLRSRLGMHNVRPGYYGEMITPWGTCKSVSLKIKTAIKYGEWAMRELRLIRRLKPPSNRSGAGGRNRSVA